MRYKIIYRYSQGRREPCKVAWIINDSIETAMATIVALTHAGAVILEVLPL